MHSFRCLWRIAGGLVLLLVTLTVHADKSSRRAAGLPGSFRTTTPGGLTGLALPDPYIQHVQDRMTIDAYQIREHAALPAPLPSPRPRYATPPRVEGAVRTVRAVLPLEVTGFRATNLEPILPPRGFRAPILDNRSEFWPPRLPLSSMAPAEREGVRLVENQLAGQGLIATLARLIDQFHPESCLADPRTTLRRLMAVGYPVDLLHHFRPPDNAEVAARPVAIVELLARRLSGGANLETVL